MKKIVDGNTACSKVAYLFSEVCSIYPITPSSPMASNIDKLTNTNYLNLFNDLPRVLEMQSEAGAAGAMHGALISGSLSSTFTASQGLLLMIPNMYKMAGEMLPGVMHVASRSLATQSLSIFGDHQDIYATRSTGFCILASTNVFDAQNLAAVAHLCAIEGSLPFIHFFDGFRTSHELNTIEEININEVLKLINFDKINEYKDRMLNLSCHKQYGMAENEDIYFQSMEARNNAYLEMPNIVNNYMDKINKIMNTNYAPFNYYGDPKAENVIIAMGSVCDTIKEVINNLNDASIGLIEVHLYRPFSKDFLLKTLPNNVKRIAVLDRTKESGSIGEPLYLDICASLKDQNMKIVGGRYGLSSKNTTPSDIYDVFYMLKHELKENFTIGIIDDVTNLSLEKQNYEIKENTHNLKIYGFGSDGMVGASKDLLKLVNKKENWFCQGYFEYDSKKSGGVTVSNIRFSNNEINKPYYITKADLLVITKFEYFYRYEMINSLKDKGILLINTNKKEEDINNLLPKEVQNYLLDHLIKTYFIDAEQLAMNCNLKGKISKIMENVILYLMDKDYEKEIIESVKIEFATKGEDIVNNNIKGIKEAKKELKELNYNFEKQVLPKENEKDIFELIRNRKGNTLTVKDCLPLKTGAFPADLAKNDKRKISEKVPCWQKENCIQCGLCSLVCPHAVIRPYIDKLNDGIPLSNNNDYNYKILVSSQDCTGCASCVNICPGKNGIKALEMQEFKDNNVLEYFEEYENPNVIDKFNIKGSQLQKPLFEFSGACAGCGEAPYIKLLTQLYGKNIVIANATGCSSIYGGSAPSTPYLLPWANSLFEDNAEFALGIHLSYKQKRERIKKVMEETIDLVDNNEKEIFDKFINNFNNNEITNEVKEELKDKVIPKELKDLINYLPSRTVWAIGGDGWAYDIGYGGLDHVLHTNENIKVLVLDTEVYSNTGGQASKSTKLGAVAEFANMGKKTNKKDLFKIATCIPNCYVASISLGANPMQTIKAFKEATEHDGPAIIIAYAPCIEQGIKKGMGFAIEEQKLAVECGYNILMRYKDDKLFIDSPKPDFEKYLEFLNNEVRFNALYIKDSKLANELYEKQKVLSQERYEMYLDLSKHE